MHRWVPGTARFVSLGSQPRGTGTLQLWELDGAELSQSEAEERRAGLKCGCFGAGSPGRLAIGTCSGQLQIVDAERLGASADGDSAAAGCSSTVFSVQAHEGLVNGLDVFAGSEQVRLVASWLVG